MTLSKSLNLVQQCKIKKDMVARLAQIAQIVRDATQKQNKKPRSSYLTMPGANDLRK